AARLDDRRPFGPPDHQRLVQRREPLCEQLLEDRRDLRRRADGNLPRLSPVGDNRGGGRIEQDRRRNGEQLEGIDQVQHFLIELREVDLLGGEGFDQQLLGAVEEGR